MALSANQVITSKKAETRKMVPVAAGAIHIYTGALLNYGTDGYATLASDTSGERFCGIATQELNQATGGTDGDNSIEVIPVGSGEIVNMTTGTIAVTDVGVKVYANSDDQVELAATTSNDVEVGTIRKFLSTTSAEVQI